MIKHKSWKEIKRLYHQLLKDVDESEFFKTRDNKTNCYSCKKCGHVTKTKDVDSGVTPAMMDCENCNGIAHSSFYNDIAPNKAPTIEWYRPSLRECLKMRKRPALLEHVLKGGLLDREIKRK